MDRRFLRTAAIIALTLGAACTPVRTHSGFRADFNNAQIPDPVVGVDTKATVTQNFGTPSTTAIFDQTTWYYISATQEQFAFYEPRTVERRVLEVKFDQNNIVSSVTNYGLQDGRVIAYDDHVTPTRGRELGFLEQVFGTIGNGPPIRTDENQGGRPDDR